MGTKTRTIILNLVRQSRRVLRYWSEIRIGFAVEFAAEEEFEYGDVFGWSWAAFCVKADCGDQCASGQQLLSDVLWKRWEFGLPNRQNILIFISSAQLVTIAATTLVITASCEFLSTSCTLLSYFFPTSFFFFLFSFPLYYFFLTSFLLLSTYFTHFFLLLSHFSHFFPTFFPLFYSFFLLLFHFYYFFLTSFLLLSTYFPPFFSLLSTSVLNTALK